MPEVITKSRTKGLKEFEKQAVSRFVQKRYERNENFRSQYYPTWYEILAFLQNEHYATFAPGVGYYETEKPTDETHRSILNFLTGGHLNLIAKTIKNKPRVTFSPVSSGSVREDAVRFMRQVDNFLHAKLERNRVFKEALGWAYACGMGFDKSFWDPNAGDLLFSRKIGTTDEEKRHGFYEDLDDVPLPVFERQVTGEIIHESRGIFEIGWDMYSSFYETNHVYEVQTPHIEQFREDFPDSFHVAKLRGNVEWLPMEFWRTHLMMNLDAQHRLGMYSVTSKGADSKEMIRVVEHYEKPNDVWPEGAMIHWTPDNSGGDDAGILNIDVCPFSMEDEETGLKRIWQWHPYSCFYDYPIPGKTLHMGSIQFGIPTQQMINRTASSTMEFINTAAKYRVLTQEGLGQIDRDGFKDHHMNFIPVKGDPKGVQVMPTAQMSSEVKSMMDDAQKALDKILGQTLDDEAQAVKSGLSGDAIEFLDALQGVKMIPRIEMYVEAMCRTSRHQILLARKHYGEDPRFPRLVLIAGRGGTSRVRNFDKSLIALDFQVICEGISELSRSVAARKNEIFKYFSAGAFGPVDSPQASQTLMKTSEFAQMDDVHEEAAVTDNLVNNRLDCILDNADPPDDGPWHFEDHATSIKVIDIFRRKNYGRLSMIQRKRVDYLSVMHQFLQGKKAGLTASGLNIGAEALTMPGVEEGGTGGSGVSEDPNLPAAEQSVGQEPYSMDSLEATAPGDRSTEEAEGEME